MSVGAGGTGVGGDVGCSVVVAVALGSRVRILVGVLVGVRVEVGEGVGLAVGVCVSVHLGEGVGVYVGVRVGEGVAVSVGVHLGEGVGLAEVITISLRHRLVTCGSCPGPVYSSEHPERVNCP